MPDEDKTFMALLFWIWEFDDVRRTHSIDLGIWIILLSWGRDIWIFVPARDHKSFPGVGNLSYIWPHIFARG